MLKSFDIADNFTGILNAGVVAAIAPVASNNNITLMNNNNNNNALDAASMKSLKIRPHPYLREQHQHLQQHQQQQQQQQQRIQEQIASVAGVMNSVSGFGLSAMNSSPPLSVLAVGGGNTDMPIAPMIKAEPDTANNENNGLEIVLVNGGGGNGGGISVTQTNSSEVVALEINPKDVDEFAKDQPDPDNIKMFVGQIPKSMDEVQLKKMFEQYGRVHTINVLRDKLTSQSRGCCFVTYYTRKAALKAQDALHNIKTLDGNMQHLSKRTALGMWSKSCINFVLHSESLYELEKHFSRIFGVINRETYAYLPFADCKTQRISDSGPIPDAIRNLNGYAIRTAIPHDIPRVFTYNDKNGIRQIGGIAPYVFFGFVQKHNATFTEVNINASKDYYDKAVMKALCSSEIEMIMNPYILGRPFQLTYPIRFVRLEVVVPYNGYISPNEYFLRPFKTATWIAIILMGIYITFMEATCYNYIDEKLRIWPMVSQTISIFLEFSTERKITRAYRLYILIFAFSFILSNLYISLLTSYLTVYIKSKHFDTFQDIMDNNLSVLVPDYQRSYILKHLITPTGFGKFLIAVNTTDFTSGWYENKSVGFVSTSEKSAFLLSEQPYLKQPLFHVCKDYFAYYILGFRLHQYSPFYDTFNRYAVEVLQSGLITKWDSKVVQQGLEAGILTSVRDKSEPFTALTMHHVTFAYICYVVGLSLSIIAFIGEMVHKF